MRALFPHMLRHESSQLVLVGQSRDVRQGISGAQTVVASMGGHWRAKLTFWLTNEASVLALQAFAAQMEGQLGTALVPLIQAYGPRDRDGVVLPRYALAGLGGVSPYLGEGAEVAEHFGFECAPVVMAQLRDDAPLRSTRIAVDYPNSTGLRPGQYFSLGERVYWVKLAWEGPDGAVVEFSPPLRSAALAGDVVVLDRLQCLMRLASESEVDVIFSAEPAKKIELSFIEAI